MEIIKADKFPIGGTQILRTENYTNHSLELKPNDTIYFSTDGYADQFGGENFKKIMTAKFKELLLSIQHLSMTEQKNSLQQFFNKWKGNNEQVDDVLVIGIKI
jgi:serine phosphatase RsbU (regulator of sigma subunit)